MIFVATAHFHVADWIEIQHDYLKRHLTEPFRVYGSLEGIDDSYRSFFDVLVPSFGEHAGKLNLLAEFILEEANPDDLIMFLDGDAFPVADVMAKVGPLLESNELVAVQRLENFGDRQPHPCFCVVPVRTWMAIRGDWSSGHPMRPGRTDVGCNLLYGLESRGLPWAPLLRSQSLVIEQDLLFAIYGDLVYHHGAGVRGIKPKGQSRTEWTVEVPVTDMMEKRVEKFAKNHPERFERMMAKALEAAVVGEEIRQQVLDDPDFFASFLPEERPAAST